MNNKSTIKKETNNYGHFWRLRGENVHGDLQHRIRLFENGDLSLIKIIYAVSHQFPVPYTEFHS